MVVILSPAKNMNIEKFENFELENPSFLMKQIKYINI